jgi:hypothetical protein
MVDVKITPELVIDLNALLADFGMFMSLNLMHADQGLSGASLAKVKELIEYSNKNYHNTSILETPIHNHIAKNIKIVSNNLSVILKFLHNYLKYAKPIVAQFVPSRLERVKALEDKYSQFMKKYF